MATSRACFLFLGVLWQTVQASAFASESGWQVRQQDFGTKWRIGRPTESAEQRSSQSEPPVLSQNSRLSAKTTQHQNNVLEVKRLAEPPTKLGTGFQWFGTASFKNNYVFSTGTEIDDKPVMQFWARGTLDNGFFVDIWSNVPLASGNPNRSAEIDYSIGYSQELGDLGEITAALTYYDIQTPDVFKFQNDVWGPVLKWQKGDFYTEGMYFFVDGDRDGFRVVNSLSKTLMPKLKLWGNLNYADGPFASQQAIIGKLGLSYYNSDSWLNSIGFEVSDILYAENDDDPRGFAATFTMSKDLF